MEKALDIRKIQQKGMDSHNIVISSGFSWVFFAVHSSPVMKERDAHE